MAAFWLSVCRWRGRHLALEDAGFIVSGVYPVGGDNLMVRNVGILEAKPA